MTGKTTSHAQPRAFPQTRWSVVLAAKRETSAASAAALETICRAYWYPLYAYVRRSGHSSRLQPDEAFDQQWAITLHDLTLERLENEFAAAGKAHEFETLKDCLMAVHGEIDYTSVAERMGSSEGAARVAVHRLRKRFRDIYREEIAQTLSETADVDAELRHLARALART